MERSRLLTLSAFAVAVPLAVLPAAAQAGSPSVSDEVRNGKIETSSQPHPGTNVQWGRAVALIDAPIDDVMAVIQNYGGYKTFLPHFEESRVLSQRGASALVYVKVSVMRGAANLWAEVKLKPRAGDGATRVIEGAMTKGNMDHFEAVWEVTPVEGGTLVAFQILVDPDLPLPASLITDENLKTRTQGAARAAHVDPRAQGAAGEDVISLVQDGGRRPRSAAICITPGIVPAACASWNFAIASLPYCFSIALRNIGVIV